MITQPTTQEVTMDSPTPSERIVWGLDFSVRKQGYLWAMMRAKEGKDYKNWERDNSPEVGSGHPMFSFWLGFSTGIKQFVERLEDTALDDLLAEELTIIESNKHEWFDHSYRIQALEDVSNAD